MITERIRRNVPLKEYTTFKIGGLAKYFLEAKNKEELMAGIQWAKQQGLPFFILGGGSNLLISDEGFDGLVLRISSDGFQFDGERLKVEAGANLSLVVNECLKKRLSGLEWASGIPKITVGGAVYGNAGAFGVTCADMIESVELLDTDTMTIKTISFEECQFDYKESIFKKNKNLIILSVVFRLEAKAAEEIEKEIKRALFYRREHHSSEPSAGSVFKNPFQIPAGELIENCGLKGKRIGNAQISLKHANFIVNLGEAKAQDVKNLIDLAKKEVQNKFNILLEEEVQYLGF
ncbi:MAG: UDP-N-acetylmuramate dehydrogenase [Candidatus Pacebacteria bacterium]|nr:UDP-N-acetylmuramate dehydrogenase [Candidatus Paceibacterota bacterium]